MSVNGWFPKIKHLILMIQQYPIIYVKMKDPTMTNKQYQMASKNAWKLIATKLVMRSQECIQIWTKIIYKYAKIKSLISTGKVSEKAAMFHQKIGRYLDGTLSFLDPYLQGIEVDIPLYIHKRVNALFGLPQEQNKYTTAVSHEKLRALLKKREKEEVDDSDCIVMQYLQNVVEDVIKRKLKEVLSNDNTVSNRAIPDPSTSNVNTDNEKEIAGARICFGSKSQRFVEEVYQLDRDSENGNVEDHNTNDNDDSLPESHILVSDTMTNETSGSNVDTIVIENNIEHVTTVTETSDVSDHDMRKMFKELGELLSLELSMEKQRLLKTRINCLVRNILEQV